MRRRTVIRAVVIIAAALALLIGGILLFQKLESDKDTETRGDMSEGFGQLRTVEWNGKTYRAKPAVTTLLIAGTDRHGDPDATGSKEYRRGSPADFLLLLAIDHTDKKIHQLQIDRDTMADVTVLGVFGNEAGTRVMQICLAHYYGKTLEDNAKYTVDAVSRLLDELADIDGYYMIDYSTVPVLNDALGGVKVKMQYDMTSVHPEWKQGAEIELHGKDAEDFVRSRMTIGSGTNEERMDRQAEYMKKAIQKIKSRISADLEFGEDLLEKLKTYATTNITAKRLADEMNRANSYEIMPIDHPEGEYGMDENDEYVEFHMRENAAAEWVLDHLYTVQD